MPTHSRWRGGKVSSAYAALIALIIFAQPPQGRGAECADCNGDGVVTISDLIAGVNIALGNLPLAACTAIDRNTDGTVTVDELIAAVATALYECAAAPTSTATPQGMSAATRTDTPTSTPTVDAVNRIPTEARALITWLQAGNYLGWRAESGPHPSAGPHFGIVRAFINDDLFDSLSANDTRHLAGAAAVKELYGPTATVVRGWAVMLKVQDESDNGRGWYWYETFDGSGGGGIGDPVCTGCHSQGRDFVRIPFPLQ